ncbi:MAG: quinate 5-dehydrogenase [bacterium]|nr:quinate 5-dehydrogenase [bacterium]
MIRVVSVSLGSSARDKTGRATFLGEMVELSRVGTDGDFSKALRIIGELDGQVDAIGLGGIDLYLWAGGRRYTIRDAARLAAMAKTTPVVDGSILKLLLEPRIVEQLALSLRGVAPEPLSAQRSGAGASPSGAQQSSETHPTAQLPKAQTDEELLPPLKGSKVLLVSAVDRWGMAQALAKYAGQIVFGDMMFALGLPFPMRTLKHVERAAKLIAPVITKLPFQMLYPTGDKQKEHKPKFSEYFNWADWICGDFHYISRNIPPRLDGKVVLTNTTTEADQQRLAEHGLSWLVTTTPVVDGRSFGMNVLEGCLAALITRAGGELSQQNYEIYLNKLDLKPNVMKLR